MNYQDKVKQALGYIRADGLSLPHITRKGTFQFYSNADAAWFSEETGIFPNVWKAVDGRMVFEFPDI